MSINFECRGVTLWFPATEVARLFLSQVAILEKRLGSSSGLRVGNSSDDVAVNSAELDAFLHSLASELNLGHPSVSLLLKGVCVHLLALSFLAGEGSPDVLSLFPSDWNVEAQLLVDRNSQR